MFSVLLFTLGLATQTPSWPAIDTALPRVGGGERDVAVVVGVSQYPALPRIDGAAENAAAWHQYLLRVRGLRSENIILLRDSDATKERILDATRASVISSAPGGIAWFIFVGHGAPASNGNDGMLVGADTQPNAQSLTARGVTQHELLTLLSTGRQSETVAVFDACFTGQTPTATASLVPGLMPLVPVDENRHRVATQIPQTVLSSSPTFAGPLPKVKRPAFSFLLLGALRGWGDQDNDGAVTLNEAFDWSKASLRVAIGVTDSVPSIVSSHSSLVTARAQVSRPDIDAIVIGRCPSGSGWRTDRCVEGAPSIGSGPSPFVVAGGAAAILGAGVAIAGGIVLKGNNDVLNNETSLGTAKQDAANGWQASSAALIVGVGIAAVGLSIGGVGLLVGEEQ